MSWCVLQAVAGQFHERLLERRALRGELVERQAMLCGQFRDAWRVQAGHDERAHAVGGDLRTVLAEQPGQGARVRRADPYRLARAARGELVGTAVRVEPAAPDDDQVVGR